MARSKRSAPDDAEEPVGRDDVVPGWGVDRVFGPRRDDLPVTAPGVEVADGFDGANQQTYSVAWSPDGGMIAATAAGGDVRMWRRGSDGSSVGLVGHRAQRAVRGLGWHPTKPLLATASDDGSVCLWDVGSGRHEVLRELGVGVKGIAWSPDGTRLAVSDSNGRIGIWDPVEPERLREVAGHKGAVYGPCWSSDGSLLVTGGLDGDVRIWLAEDLQVLRHIPAPANSGAGLPAITLSGDDALIACGQDDGLIRVVETATGRDVTSLEGHRHPVVSLAFSPGGEVLASATGREISLWRRRDWECVVTLAGGGAGVGGLAFHPSGAVLAAKNNYRRRIDCWSIDFDMLDATAVAAQSRRYVNAKVVLLGDTGVGKSGLGLVLSGQDYAPTDSTHGRKVWVFEPENTEARASSRDAREVLLWDLAGQPGYRLVHQLHLNEVAVALVVFDARSETDPFAGVHHWSRALAHARRLEADAAVPVRTFLVAARADRGGVPVTTQRIAGLVDDLGLDGFFETSAKEGWKISELKDAMLDAIDWDLLPTVSSNVLLEEIRAYVLGAKQDGRVLVTIDDLFREYGAGRSMGVETRDLRLEFEACLGRVEGRGLVRRLRFGGFVLLQPELLDAYASALVQAAKEEPDGLGVIAEEDALEGRFKLADAERIGPSEQEKLLLIATVEELLRHEVALKETTDRGVDLVFPSQFTRERPDAPHIPGRELTLGFQGSLHTIYATLAVRLARSHLFHRREMWRNVATYESAADGVCGVFLRELEEGVGELDVFFDEHADETVRRQFETYVFEHVQQRAGASVVTLRRVVRCTDCAYALPDDLVRRKLERGAREMLCPDCEACTIALIAAADQVARPEAAVIEMNRSANQRRASDMATTRLKGKVETGDFDVFLCHNSRNKAEVKAIGEQLRERGIHPWLDEWSIPPGTRWQKELAKQVKSIRSAAVFIGGGSPGPWQDVEIEGLLQRFVKNKRPLIPVILPSRTGNPRLPDFLTLWHLVDMRKADPDPLDQLVWGITRERQG